MGGTPPPRAPDPRAGLPQLGRAANRARAQSLATRLNHPAGP